MRLLENWVIHKTIELTAMPVESSPGAALRRWANDLVNAAWVAVQRRTHKG